MRLRLYIALTFLLPLFACSDKKPTTPIKYPDQTPPAKTSSLWVCDENTTWADICWYAPGDDSLTGKAIAYEIRYSPEYITDSTWDSCAIAPQTLVPRDPTVGERFRLTGLDSGATYFAAIKTVDDIGNWSAMSNIVAINARDTTPPNPIGDLIGEVDGDSTITLRWTVPSDPESTRRLFKYDIRYAPSAINSDNWNSATSVPRDREPAPAGAPDSIILKWSDTSRYLFFGIKSVDLAMNPSSLSNVVKLLAPNIDIIPIDTASGNDSTRLVWEVEHDGRDFKSVDASALNSDGEIFLLSTIGPPPHGPGDVLVMKSDSLGVLAWATPANAAIGLDVSPDEYGGCFVFAGNGTCASVNGGGYVAHFAANGTLINEWCFQFTNVSEVSHGIICQDGGFAFAGSGWDNNSQTAFIVKIDPNGVEQWSRYPFQENMCPAWGDPPLSAFASGGALCLSSNGQIIAATSFSYSDQVTITGCGFQRTHLMLIEFDPLTAGESECQITSDPLFIPAVSEIAQFHDGRFCGLIWRHDGASYFVTDLCRTAHVSQIPADQRIGQRGALRPIPGLAKSIVVGLKAEPSPATTSFDFSAMVLGESGIVEQRLIWGDSAVIESSPVVSVAPDGAVTVAGLRGQGTEGLQLVVARIRFRL